MLSAVTQGEEGLGSRTSKSELTNRVVDLAKSSRRSNMKACYLLDQRITNKEMDQMDEICHWFQG
jgi:hypothetical protein